MIEYVDVNGVQVDKRIFTTYFSCDYEHCKGACCWAVLDDIELDGGSLTQPEAQYIRKNREIISQFVDEKFKSEVLTKPVYQRGLLYFTSLAKETGGCLFSNTNCKTCAFKVMKEKGFPTDIPVKCALYPLWYRDVNGEKSLTLIDTFEEKFCKPAFEKGAREHTRVYKFCEDAIVRIFGEKFYRDLHFAAMNSEKITL